METDPERDSSGVLYGLRHAGVLRLIEARPHAEEIAGLTLVGTFSRRVRGEVFLTESGLQAFEELNADIALVVVGDRGGFFFREPDGSMQTVRSYQEFGVDAAESPLAPPPPAVQTVRPPRRFVGLLKALGASAILAAAGASVLYLAPPFRWMPPASLPPELQVKARGNQLLLTWTGGDGGPLEIVDNGARKRVTLASGQSSMTYQAAGQDISLELGGRSVRVLTRPDLPPSPPPDEGREQIANLENQVQDLQRKLAAQRARIGALNRAIAGLIDPQ